MTTTANRKSTKIPSFEDLKGLRAEGYVRESYKDQKDGYGPEVQRGAIESFAQAWGLSLGQAWYTDIVTGTSTLKRSSFHAFLAEAAADRFDVLLVFHTSRFARNRADSIRYKADLAKLGKTIIFVSQGIISGCERDFLNEGINEVLDEYYSITLSKWVAGGLKAKHESGIANGVPPLGYRSDKLDNGKRERKVPDLKGIDGNPKVGGMEALLSLLRGYASGQQSYQTVADTLNAQGYRNRVGDLFSKGSVEHVLSNRFYEGKAIFHPGEQDEKVKEGKHEVPAEVKELWLKCQDVKRQRTKPWNRGATSRAKPRTYLFSGILTCEDCGSRYKGLAIHKGQRVRQRLIHQRGTCGIRPRSQLMDQLSQQFADKVLPALVIGSDFRDYVMKARGRANARPMADKDIQRLQNALQQIRKQNQWGDLCDEEYLNEREKLQGQLQFLKSSVPSAPQSPDLERRAEMLNSLPGLWQHPGVQDSDRQQLLMETFEEVMIHGKELVAVRPKPQYAPHFAYLTLGERGCLAEGGVHSPRDQCPQPFIPACWSSASQPGWTAYAQNL